LAASANSDGVVSVAHELAADPNDATTAACSHERREWEASEVMATWTVQWLKNEPSAFVEAGAAAIHGPTPTNATIVPPEE
jgi:hypothetical protein